MDRTAAPPAEPPPFVGTCRAFVPPFRPKPRPEPREPQPLLCAVGTQSAPPPGPEPRPLCRPATRVHSLRLRRGASRSPNSARAAV
eukprot:7185511-Prymnesium_polylepis.2